MDSVRIKTNPFWADASTILGKTPENFRRKAIQIAEAYGQGAAAKACLKVKLPATLKSVRQGGYLGHTLMLNALGFRGPEGDYPEGVSSHVHTTMQLVPAAPSSATTTPVRVPEQTFTPGAIPMPQSQSQSAGPQFLTSGASALEQDQRIMRVQIPLIYHL